MGVGGVSRGLFGKYIATKINFSLGSFLGLRLRGLLKYPGAESADANMLALLEFMCWFYEVKTMLAFTAALSVQPIAVGKT